MLKLPALIILPSGCNALMVMGPLTLGSNPSLALWAKAVVAKSAISRVPKKTPGRKVWPQRRGTGGRGRIRLRRRARVFSIAEGRAFGETRPAHRLFIRRSVFQSTLGKFFMMDLMRALPVFVH